MSPQATEEAIAPRPHHVHPSLASVRLILAVKNFAAIKGVCHIGLGVTATNTVKVLRRYGVHAEAWPAQTAAEIEALIAADFEQSPRRAITHVVVSAPSWVQPADFKRMCLRWPDVEFVMLNHSGTAYLSIDKYGIRNNRELIDLEMSLHNMRVAANNPRVSSWLSQAFGFEAALLTNLYDCETFVEPAAARRDHDPLRIGSFGAGRPWKNQLSAAEAAVQMARRLGVGVELYVNTMRPDGGERMIESRKELFDDLPGCKLIEAPWQSWPKFRRVVRSMDLMISASFDETFCVVVADGIAEGTPSVVTGAMEWAPTNWWCEPFDPASIMRVGMGLLHDPYTIHDARGHLRRHVDRGVLRWVRYLTRQPELLAEA
jgi:glycosyltransferase involved in cell wall biosynthesis